jgi:hypothetical protein
MSDGPAFQKLGFSALHIDAEVLLAELESSLDQLRHLDVRESEPLVKFIHSLTKCGANSGTLSNTSRNTSRPDKAKVAQTSGTGRKQTLAL